jgi:cytochrome P450
MGHHEPVLDFANDFDHTDDAWAADPYPIIEELRTGECPVAHSERYGGVWMPTTHEMVSQIAYDTERFTSRSVVVSEFRPPMFLAPAGIAPPISADPPYHMDSRRMLLPIFAPQRIAALEYTQHIPVRVIANMLGLPEEDADEFRGFVNHVLEGVSLPMEQRAEGMMGLFGYLQKHMEDHIANPRDDVISILLDSEIDGQKLDPFQVGRTIGLLLIAGIDTTWSAIGASLWHLAKTPSDLKRLVAEPELLPTAIEEFLRAYAPVTMARLVREDMEWNGCPMKAEEWVLLSFPAANRDPNFFDRADEVIIDRQENRHAAFGLGVHRCAGSHLARMEMRVALEVWLENFPDFSLADPDAVRWSGGQVRGPRILPVQINR